MRPPTALFQTILLATLVQAPSPPPAAGHSAHWNEVKGIGRDWKYDKQNERSAEVGLAAVPPEIADGPKVDMADGGVSQMIQTEKQAISLEELKKLLKEFEDKWPIERVLPIEESQKRDLMRQPWKTPVYRFFDHEKDEIQKLPEPLDSDGKERVYELLSALEKSNKYLGTRHPELSEILNDIKSRLPPNNPRTKDPRRKIGVDKAFQLFGLHELDDPPPPPKKSWKGWKKIFKSDS